MPTVYVPVEKAPAKHIPGMGVLGGFRRFISDYGILPLAIGVVIGNAVNDLVKTLVDGFITPLIGLISPQSTLQNLQFTVNHSVFKVGAIINATLSFIVIALVIYVFAKIILHNEQLLKK